jgi:hypothetical protein
VREVERCGVFRASVVSAGQEELGRLDGFQQGAKALGDGYSVGRRQMSERSIGYIQKEKGGRGDTQVLHGAAGFFAAESGEGGGIDAWMVRVRASAIGDINNTDRPPGRTMRVNESAAPEGFIVLVRRYDDTIAARLRSVFVAAQPENKGDNGPNKTAKQFFHADRASGKKYNWVLSYRASSAKASNCFW